MFLRFLIRFFILFYLFENAPAWRQKRMREELKTHAGAFLTACGSIFGSVCMRFHRQRYVTASRNASVCRYLFMHVEPYQPVHGRGCDGVYAHTIALCRMNQYLTEVPCDGAREADGVETPTVIEADVAAYEGAEAFEHKAVDTCLVEVVSDKGRERGQKPVGERLAIDAFDDVAHREPVSAEEVFAHAVRHYPPHQVAYEALAQVGSASLITQYEAQGRHVLHHALAVPKARVGARAQDAGYSFMRAQQGAGGPHHVGAHLYFALRTEAVAQDGAHAFGQFGRGTSRAIEMQRVGHASAERRKQLLPDDTFYFFLIQIHRVDARSA